MTVKIRTISFAIFAIFAIGMAPRGYTAEIKTFAGVNLGIGGSRCLDVLNYGAANGSPIQQYQCTGGSNQHWSIKPNGQILGHGNRCLSVVSSARANGTRVHIWDCMNPGQTDFANQNWYIYNGQIRLADTGMCLDVILANTADGTPMQIWSCSGAQHQKYLIN
jgi:hypothetical protein